MTRSGATMVASTPGRGAMGHHHENHHHHDHHRHETDAGGHRHDTVRLTSPFRLDRLPRPVHRLGRRRFLAELGRGTFAVAILGAAAACSGDSSSSPTTGTAAPRVTSAPTGGDDPDELRWSQVALGSVSAYVLVRGNSAAVVDTGNPGSADQIGESLALLGVTYDDVDHVVLTHHHPDHIGSLPAVLDRAPAARTYAGAADIPTIGAPVEVQAVADGDDVFGLEVIETPGHTPGSISVLDTGIGLLVAGDALNGNAEGTGISGANERFTSDMAVAGESIRKLADLEFDIAAFGHGNPVVGGAGALVDALAAEL